MDPCNPNTNLNYARSQVKVNYNLNNVYARRLNKRNICSIYTRCKNAKTLPPLKLSTYNEYVFLVDPRSPLIARDYVILMGRPDKKDVQRIAKKIKLVKIKDKTKKELLINIYGKLRKMNITEPIRLNTKVRLTRNINSFGEFNTLSEPTVNGEPTSLEESTTFEETTSPGETTTFGETTGLEETTTFGETNGNGGLTSLGGSSPFGNIFKSNAPKVNKLKPKVKYPIKSPGSINLSKQERIFNTELNMKRKQINLNAKKIELENMKKRKANAMLNLEKQHNALKKPKVNNSVVNKNINITCPLVGNKRVCKLEEQKAILKNLKQKIQELRNKI